MIGWALRRLLGLVALVLGLPLRLLGAVAWRLARRDALVVHLADAVPDAPTHEGWPRSWLAARPPGLDLATALAALEEAAGDRRLAGVVVVLERAGLRLVQAEALAQALDRARAAGKKVLVFADATAAPALVVGAVADRFLVAPEGVLGFAGVRAAAPFLADLLAALGVGVDLDHEGPYKSYSDTFTRRGMSAAHREAALALARDLYEQVVSALVAGRAIERRRLEGLIDAAPTPHRAVVAEGLACGLAWRDQVDEAAGALLGVEGRDLAAVPPGAYVARRRRREARAAALRDPPLVAVATLEGAIVPGVEGRGVPAHAWVEVLEALREDARIRAVVLRIDSPGGAAEASDDLWRAARRLDREKPVVASLGGVAASGGYYVAVGARRIVAHAATLTGSIGVVAGKLHLGPLLERLGVRLEGPAVGARAGLWDPDRPFSDDERAAARLELERVYRTFLDRVAEGRGKALAEVEALAQGRVYTGRQALPLGLVDRLGGLDEALAEARGLADLTRAPRVVRVHPARRGWAALAFGGGLGGAAPGLEDLATALALARCRALAWCPWTVRGHE